MEAYPVAEPTILFIDDDEMACISMQYNLQEQGFNVICALNGRDGLRQLYDSRPDLIMLDLHMPQMDGFTICQRIREISDVPIIIVSTQQAPEDVARILKMGADDYVSKPYDSEVLAARAHATLRRAAAEPIATNYRLSYSDDHLSINFSERRVLVKGEPVRLSPTEYRLLEMLVQESPRVVTYRALLENVWGFEYINDIDYLRVYIWHLRNKLEPDSKNPVYILNELGVGYRFQRHL